MPLPARQAPARTETLTLRRSAPPVRAGEGLPRPRPGGFETDAARPAGSGPGTDAPRGRTGQWTRRILCGKVIARQSNSRPRWQRPPAGPPAAPSGRALHLKSRQTGQGTRRPGRSLGLRFSFAGRALHGPEADSRGWTERSADARASDATSAVCFPAAAHERMPSEINDAALAAAHTTQCQLDTAAVTSGWGLQRPSGLPRPAAWHSPFAPNPAVAAPLWRRR